MGYLTGRLSGASPLTGGVEPAYEDHDERREAAGSGIFGFGKNIFRDLGDIVGGVGQLIGTVATDAVKAVGTVATAGQVDFDFKTDDIVNGITGGALNMFGEGWDPSTSVLLQDYGDRYGDLAQGDVSQFGREMYEHPLSFITDALAVATAGGAAAAKGAAVAAKSGEVGAAAKALGAANVADEVAMAAKGVVTAEDIGSAAAFVQRVQGTTTKYINPITKRVEFIDPMRNPVKRKLYQDPLMSRIMQKGEGAELAEHLAETAVKSGPGGLEQYVRALEIRKMANAATTGEVPVMKTWAATLKTRKMVDKMFGRINATSKLHAADLDRAIRHELDNLPDGISEDDLVEALMGTNGTLMEDGYSPATGKGLRRAEDFGVLGARSVVEDVRWGGKSAPSGPTPVAEGAVATLTDDQVRASLAGLSEAVEQAATDRRVLTPALRDEFGPGVVVPGAPKSAEAVARKAEVGGGDWRDVDDISRFRLVMDDLHNPATQAQAIERLQKTTGGRVRKVENTLGQADADGSRMVRVVVEMPDGHPVEFQLVTKGAHELLDATEHLRAGMAGLALIAKEGGQEAIDAGTQLRKAQRLSQQLWERETAELREALGGHADDAVRKKVNNIRVAVHKNLTDPAIEGGLGIDNVFDNTFLPQRFNNGAAWDETEGALVGGGETLELDDLLAQSGQAAPVYFPMVDARRLPRRGDFMLSKPGGGSAMRLVEDTNLRRNSGYLLKEDLFSKDIRRTYQVRAQRAARAAESYALTQQVMHEYSRRVTDWTQKADDEVIWSPQLYSALYKTERASDDALLRGMAEGVDEGESAAAALQRVVVQNQDHMARIMRDQDIEMYAVPKVVADRLARQTRVHLGSNTDVFFSTPTAMWKQMTLAGSPRWVTNNMLGNTAFLKMQGGRVTDVVKQLSPRFRAKLKEAIGEDALREVETGGIYDEMAQSARQYDDQTIAGGVANKVQQSAKVNKAMALPRKWGDFAHRINGGVEDAFRRASYLKAAERQAIRSEVDVASKSFWSSKSSLDATFRVGLDEKAAGRAIDEVNKFLNDYQTMSPFGRNIMRPYIAPFWGFYRHAAKMAVSLPFEHPGKSTVFRMVNETAENERDRIGMLPGWLQNSVPLGQTSAGEQRFLSTAGMNPFNTVMESPGSMFHPLWKMVFENQTGRSSFTGKQFSDADTVKAFGSDQQYRFDPGTGEMVPVDKVTPGLFQHMLMQVPQYDMVRDLIGGGSTYDTAKVHELLRGEGTIVDPETGEPMFPRDRLLNVAKLFGYSELPFDAESYQEKRMTEQETALAMYLERNPVETP